MSLPPETLSKFDHAFDLVNIKIDEEFNSAIRFHEQNPLLVTPTNTQGVVQSLFIQYLEKFSTELWEKIKKIVPESEAINAFDWEKELKEYIIGRRIHDYYLNAIERFKKFKMSETNDWYDRKYKDKIHDLKFEIGAAVQTIKNKFPKDMKDKATSITNNFLGPATNQFGDNNTQIIQQTIHNLEQQIDQLTIPAEKKEKAKGLAKELFGIVAESVAKVVADKITGG
jgi:hypothetical protein